MTILQKQMLNAVGHSVEVRIKGTGKLICGVCTGYTTPQNNEPEIAAIDIKVKGYEGLTEITEADIANLRITVLCPVTGTQVNGSDCYTICAVADREAKPTILWAAVPWSEEQRQKCLSCKYHTDIAPGKQ